MFKKPGCLLPVMMVLLFLTYISIKQGYNTIFHEDWTEDFSNQKGVVIDIVEDSTYFTSGGSSRYDYSFSPVVKYEVNGKEVVDTIDFMRSIEESNWVPGDSVTLNVNEFDGNLSKDIDTDRNFTGIVNILMGLGFLYLAYIIIRFLLRQRAARNEES